MGRPPRICSQYNFDVAKRIAELRKGKGWDQAKFAAKIKMSQSSYSRLEAGKMNVNIDHLFIVANALGLQPHQIITGIKWH
jgi:transcriptional regulator with XRE-family HTH domain